MPKLLYLVTEDWSVVSHFLPMVRTAIAGGFEVVVVDNNPDAGLRSRVDTFAADAKVAVRYVPEPHLGLHNARHAGARAATGDVLLYIDADCRVPLQWIERLERRFDDPRVVAVTGPYRFYDWDAVGRALIRAYDVVVAPPTHALVHRVFGAGAILYGGNFAVRATALAGIGGFDRSIDFHGEDTNLARRLTPIGAVRVAPDCWVWTSARRYNAMGKREVFGLYIRNFWSEILRHRPADRSHLDVRA